MKRKKIGYFVDFFAFYLVVPFILQKLVNKL